MVLQKMIFQYHFVLFFLIFPLVQESEGSNISQKEGGGIFGMAILDPNYFGVQNYAIYEMSSFNFTFIWNEFKMLFKWIYGSNTNAGRLNFTENKTSILSQLGQTNITVLYENSTDKITPKGNMDVKERKKTGPFVVHKAHSIPTFFKQFQEFEGLKAKNESQKLAFLSGLNKVNKTKKKMLKNEETFRPDD